MPTCTAISRPFALKARYEAEALGMGDLPMVILPHPVGQLPGDEMHRVADRSWEEIEASLTAPRHAN